MLPQLVAAALGIGLMASPAALGDGDAASTVAYVAGPLAASVGFVAAFPIGRPLRYALYPVALALLVLPWFLGYEPAELTIHLAVGAALAILTLGTPPAPEGEAGGGWSSLRD